MKVKSLVPLFGSNRMCAELAGAELDGCEWVGVAFAGSMAEIPHITARTLVVNDLHPHIINLAKVTADPRLGSMLYRQLRRQPFDPSTLANAQSVCRAIEAADSIPDMPYFDWALSYFLCAWMARNGVAGTTGEFKTGLSVRWNAGGGDSVVRIRNATRSILEWRRFLDRATLLNMDAFEFIDRHCKDAHRHGIYVDAPWPDDGDSYKHKFPEAAQRRLAKVLSQFNRTRVVIRYGDHPLIRDLYPEIAWSWRSVKGRTSANKPKEEVLIVNKIREA